jgi:hypothetical protein
MDAIAALCAAIAMIAGVPPASAAAAPMALVMQVTGTTDPPLARHREVPEGRITLGPQSKIALLHYASCKIVTVAGGTATITANEVVAPAANVESTKPGPCPKVHKIALAEGTASGGVSVSRGLDVQAPLASPINLASNSVIVLSGPSAAAARSFELRDGYDRVVSKPTPINDGAFALDGTESAHGPYTIRIRFDKREKPVDVQVFLLRATDGGMLVLEMD